MTDVADPNARQSAPRPRFLAVDLARTAALLAMAVYHVVFDLALFGVIAPGVPQMAAWRWLAYLTAGSFLFLAGVSLWLAHGGGLAWPRALRRLARVGGAALLVTAATYVAMPDAFVYFGILHAIALGSVFGLGLLRLPAWALLAVGAAVMGLGLRVETEALSAPVWWWTGLQAVPQRAVDYVPLFPWLAPLLWGIAAAKLAERAGLWTRLSRLSVSGWARILAWPGQHSLAVYLLHQPVLLALIWVGVQITR